jgi:hypothetical protein
MRGEVRRFGRLPPPESHAAQPGAAPTAPVCGRDSAERRVPPCLCLPRGPPDRAWRFSLAASACAASSERSVQAKIMVLLAACLTCGAPGAMGKEAGCEVLLHAKTAPASKRVQSHPALSASTDFSHRSSCARQALLLSDACSGSWACIRLPACGGCARSAAERGHEERGRRDREGALLRRGAQNSEGPATTPHRLVRPRTCPLPAHGKQQAARDEQGWTLLEL